MDELAVLSNASALSGNSPWASGLIPEAFVFFENWSG